MNTKNQIVQTPTTPAAAAPQRRANLTFNNPDYSGGWGNRPTARPELLNLLYRVDPAASGNVKAALGGRSWVPGLLAEASRVAYEHDRLWAVEVPARDGAGRAVGRAVVGTTQAGNVTTYHEGGRGIVGLGPDFATSFAGRVVLVDSPLDAWTANAVGLDGVTFVAEHAGRRGWAWAKDAVRPVVFPLDDATLKGLFQKMLAP